MIGRLAAQLRSLWLTLARRDRLERELDDELRQYLALVAAENERKGMTTAEARRAAIVQMGGVEQLKEATREVWIGSALSAAGRELRYAVRTLRRAPGFFGIAVVILGVGIAGATAVFTVVDASLLRPLPGVAAPDELVTVERVNAEGRSKVFNWPDYRDHQEQAQTLAGLAAFAGMPMTVTDSAGPTQAWVGFGSSNFFEVLGVKPAAGHFFRSGETGHVVVLGFALWQRRFAGSPGVIGSTIRLDGHPYTVIGVTPRGFKGALAGHPMEAWFPMVVNGRATPAAARFDITSRRGGALRLVGRLAPAQSVPEVQQELAVISARLAAIHATNRGRGVHVFRGAGFGESERRELSRIPRLLTMAVVLLLAIACGSVTSLSVVRAVARRRELATRISIGASRAALVRLVAFEGALIAVCACALGVFLANLLLRSATLVRTVVDVPALDLTMDSRVLTLSLGATAFTAILVSLIPAAQVLGLSPAAVLKDGGRATRVTSQRVLVGAQVGASLVLLAAASIVFGNFARIIASHGDVAPRGLTFTGVDASQLRQDLEVRRVFFSDLLQRAAAEPGVELAALTSTVPPLPRSNRAPIFRRGEEPPPDVLAGREYELGTGVNAVSVSPDFFATMRIPLLRGETFNEQDGRSGERVAIVSQGLATMLWPGENAVGRFLSSPEDGLPGAAIRVIGVVGDTRDLSVAAEAPLVMYTPLRPDWIHSLVLRGAGNAAMPPETVRRIVADVSPRASVSDVETLDARLRRELDSRRTAAVWIGIFGAIALFLAGIGVYGVVAQGVLQRTRELAIRSALGASPRRVLATVINDGLGLVALGAAVGILGAVGAFHMLRSFFTGVQMADLSFAGAAVGLLAVAMLLAAYVPARRAARLSPADALRSD